MRKYQRKAAVTSNEGEEKEGLMHGFQQGHCLDYATQMGLYELSILNPYVT